MDDFFDVEKLRRNWSRAAPQQVQEISPALAAVGAAQNLGLAFETTLERLKANALERYPSEREAIEALLSDVKTQMAQWQKRPKSQKQAAPLTPDGSTSRLSDGSIENPTASADEDNEASPLEQEAQTDVPDEDADEVLDDSVRVTLHQTLDAFEELMEAFALMHRLPR